MERQFHRIPITERSKYFELAWKFKIEGKRIKKRYMDVVLGRENISPTKNPQTEFSKKKIMDKDKKTSSVLIEKYYLDKLKDCGSTDDREFYVKQFEHFHMD